MQATMWPMQLCKHALSRKRRKGIDRRGLRDALIGRGSCTAATVERDGGR